MSANDGLILLFTSNWEALYAQDAIDLIAQPEKTLVHFRYRHKWIEGELLRKLQSLDTASTLVGRRVLCVFVDRTIHTDVPIFVPTRYGTIQGIETEGSFENIFFTVDRYFSWRAFAGRFCPEGSRNDRPARLWIDAFRQMLNADLNAGIEAGDDLRGPPGKYVTEIPPPASCSLSPYFFEGSVADEGLDFEDLVGALHTLPYFEHTIFFRIRSVEEFFSRWEYIHTFFLPFLSKSRFQTKTPRVIQARRLGGGKFGYRFRRVVPYRLRVAIVNGKKLTPAMKSTTLEVESDPKQVIVDTPSLRISAKNDFTQVLLFPVFEAADAITRISIKATASESVTITRPALEAQRIQWQNDWLSAGDRSWIDKRREDRIKKKHVISDEYPEHAPIPGPGVVLDVESTHSSFFLRVGGLQLVVGYIFLFILNEHWLTIFRGLCPARLDWFYHLEWISIGTGLFFAKMLGLYMFYCAFAVTTRKLPSLRA